MTNGPEITTTSWRRPEILVGLVSMMAAAGMVLGTGTALATPTPVVNTAAGLPLELTRLHAGNSGATCGQNNDENISVLSNVGILNGLVGNTLNGANNVVDAGQSTLGQAT